MLNIDLLPELPDTICHGVSIPQHALPAEPVPWDPDSWQADLLDDTAGPEDHEGADETDDERRELCFESCALSFEEMEASSLDNLVHLGVRKPGGRHWTWDRGQLIAA